LINQPLSASRSWLIVLGLGLGPAVSNGFARFAYGLILPSMQQDLAWSYTAAGWMNTANAIGYLVGALLALRYIGLIGAGRIFCAGMVLTTISLLASGLTSDLSALTAMRVLAGIGSAPVFIAGGVLASALFREDPSRNALAIAVYFGGGGIGMLLTGIVIPLWLEAYGAHAWPATWLMLGIASALTLLPAVWAVRALPAQSSPAGGETSHRLNIRPMLPALFSYFMFGVGYFVYMTFLVAWMRADGRGVELIVATWSMLSLMVMLSPFAWRSVLARSTGGGAVALTLACTGIGTLLPLLVAGAPGMLISAALFGIAFFMVPTSVTNFSKKNFPQAQWGAAVSLFTTVFAVGQMIGPGAAGLAADLTNSLAPGFLGAGAVLLVGAGAALTQRAVSH
jgi:MFS family permease